MILLLITAWFLISIGVGLFAGLFIYGVEKRVVGISKSLEGVANEFPH